MPKTRRCYFPHALFFVAITFAVVLAGCQQSANSSSSSTPVSNDLDTTVEFSWESGAYREESLDLELSNPSDLPIVYTNDGSLPNAASLRAPSSLIIDSSDTNRALIGKLAMEIPDFRTIVADDTLPTATVIRAAALLPDGTIGPVFTNTYFVHEDLTELFGDIAVVSIVSDPSNLFDYNTGIIAKGAIYDEHRRENERLSNGNRNLTQANYTQKGRDWEREATIELFDGSNTLSYEAPCGIRLRGHVSRIYAQKSFNIYFRDSYGEKKMEYVLFGDAATSSDGTPVTSFKSLCLRSGGNDTEMLRYRDSLLQDALGGYDFATQATRPAIAFLNGEFYGVYSLSEKYSDSYIESHYGIDSKNVVIFEDGEIDEGTDKDQALYDELMGFAERNLADGATWEEFCAAVDVQSMVDCYATQAYIGNIDFHERKNYRVWRARSLDSGNDYGDTRWRYMIYDLEYSTGLYDQSMTKPDFDTVAQYLETCPLFASAMRNPEFRMLMRERLVDLSENAFESESISSMFDAWWTQWDPWIQMSIKRFATDSTTPQWSMNLAKSFFSERASHIIDLYDKNAAAIASAG